MSYHDITTCHDIYHYIDMLKKVRGQSEAAV